MSDTFTISAAEYIWLCQLARAMRALMTQPGPEPLERARVVWGERPASVTWL